MNSAEEQRHLDMQRMLREMEARTTKINSVGIPLLSDSFSPPEPPLLLGLNCRCVIRTIIK